MNTCERRNQMPKSDVCASLRSVSEILWRVPRQCNIFRMQEPVSKSLLTKKEDIGEYKEVVHKKDNSICTSTAKITELEKEIAALKVSNEQLELRLKAENLDENGFYEVMLNYDRFFKKIWTEREELVRVKEVMNNYMENLECSYHELLEKFQKSKKIIFKMKKNQELLLNELEEYKEIVSILDEKYDNLKMHSESMIADANEQLDQKQKENMEEMAKLKLKIVQRQAKINELEKQMKVDDSRPLFAPLRNKIVDQ